jgi:hypothetical protein
MNDNDYEGMTQEYARALHQHTAIERNKEMLPLRLRTVASALMADLVPIELRVQILTSLTYVCSTSGGVPPMDAGKELALFKELLLGDRGDTLAKAMLNDAVVQKVLATAARHKDRTVEKVRERIRKEEEAAKKKVVQLHPADDDK